MQDYDKVGIGTTANIEVSRRYAIAKKSDARDDLIPVPLLEGSTEYEVRVPRENLRIKTRGGSTNFVHGGISLQELVVPIIRYQFLRNDYKQYQRNRSAYDTKPVELSLVSPGQKVTNPLFKLQFLQKDPVGPNREKATYKIYFEDEKGEPVSSIARITAERTSHNPQERTYEQTFSLKQRRYKNSDKYFLVIEGKNGAPTSRTDFQVDVPYVLDDLDLIE